MKFKVNRTTDFLMLIIAAAVIWTAALLDLSAQEKAREIRSRTAKIQSK